jgi:DNA-binding response OmpR family regulator
MRVLIVEDEERIAAFLVKGLTAHGYAVEHAPTGKHALARAEQLELDLVVLDLRLPDLDGLVVLRALRQAGNAVPVLVLTARTDVRDRVEGLELGADDYLTKPFAFDELLARMRALMRRHNAHEAAVLRAGGIALDLKTRRAAVDDRAVDLTAREFALLEAFLRNAGQVLSREQLLSNAWGFHSDPGTNVVDVYVGYLRRKLGPDRIETVRGMGYRLLAA